MKKCTVCQILKPLIEFHKMKISKDGYRCQCKNCRIKINKTYRIKNKKILVDKAKKYFIENKHILSKINKTRKEKINNNKQEHNKQVRTYMKKYRIKNCDIMREKQKNYRYENKEKIKEWNKQYYNKIKHIRAWRSILSNTLSRFGKHKEGRTIDLLGYSALDLKEHITSLFTDGMSWDNYGDWHIDHIKPVSKFNKDTSMNVVNALSNLQPMWATTRMINGIIYEGNLNKATKV